MPTLAQYDGVEKFKGVLLDASADTVTLRSMEGVEYILDLDRDVEITADGKSVSKMSSSYEDSYAELYFDKDEKTITRAVIDTKSDWIQGQLKTSDTTAPVSYTHLPLCHRGSADHRVAPGRLRSGLSDRIR